MLENIVLTNLVLNEDYSRKVFPYLKKDYFEGEGAQVLFSLFVDYYKEYQGLPSVEALAVELSHERELPEFVFDEAKKLLHTLKLPESKADPDWLFDRTEKWCQERAIHNALRSAIGILDDKTGKTSKNQIPKLLTEALGVSFDVSLGHAYKTGWKERLAAYRNPERRIPFRLKVMNRACDGGVERKSLNVLMAPPGAGKTLVLTDLAYDYLRDGFNVVYFTMEMAERRIAERIDANYLDVPMGELKNLPMDFASNGFDNLFKATQGEIIIKEYPTTQAGVPNFRHFLNELKLKKNFKPDIIFVDYLNICASSAGKNANTYEKVKMIAEEMRGLMVEMDVVGWTATQTNRGGMGVSDFEMTETSDSTGTPMIADLFWGIINTEELAEQGQLLIKQLKNRYDDMNKMLRFLVGVDKPKMRLYDLDDMAMEISKQNDNPIFDASRFGNTMMSEGGGFGVDFGILKKGS